MFAAAVLGSSLAFLISRYLARAAIEHRLAGNQKFAAIDRAVGQQGRRIVFLLRLSPAFPFNLLNYALGLTSVRFADYLAASVGMLPGTLLYVYSGKAVGDVAALAGGAAPERGASDYALLGVGLLATAVVTVLVTRIARRALDEADRRRRRHETDGLRRPADVRASAGLADGRAQPGARAATSTRPRGATPSPRAATTSS